MKWGGVFFCKKVENGDVFFVKKWKMGGVKMFFFLKKVDLSSTQGALCTVSVFFNLHFYLFGGGEVRTHPMHPTCLRACGHVDEWCRNEPTDMPFRGTYAQCTHSGWRNLVLYGSRDPHLPGKGHFFLGGETVSPGIKSGWVCYCKGRCAAAAMWSLAQLLRTLVINTQTLQQCNQLSWIGAYI